MTRMKKLNEMPQFWHFGKSVGGQSEMPIEISARKTAQRNANISWIINDRNCVCNHTDMYDKNQTLQHLAPLTIIENRSTE